MGKGSRQKTRSDFGFFFNCFGSYFGACCTHFDGEKGRVFW